MRKLLSILAVGVFAAAVLAVPVTALAKHHRSHHRSHHRTHHRARTTVREVNGGATGSGATVQSFQGGVLTIALHQTPMDTRTVSGQVNSGTEIKCEMSMPTAQTADHGGARDDNGAGDNRGDHNRGDDHGDNRGNDNEANDPEGVENENEANDNEANENGNQANAPQCGPGDLTPGAAVRDAELRIGSGSTAVFREVDLVK
jgi:hypothetical protein